MYRRDPSELELDTRCPKCGHLVRAIVEAGPIYHITETSDDLAYLKFTDQSANSGLDASRGEPGSLALYISEELLEGRCRKRSCKFLRERSKAQRKWADSQK